MLRRLGSTNSRATTHSPIGMLDFHTTVDSCFLLECVSYSLGSQFLLYTVDTEHFTICDSFSLVCFPSPCVLHKYNTKIVPGTSSDGERGSCWVKAHPHDQTVLVNTMELFAS